MQALVLDLDGTLLDDATAIRRGFAAFVEAHHALLGNETEPELLSRWYQVSGAHWRRFERGEVSFTEQRRARVRDFLNQSLSDREADTAFEHYGQAYEAAWELAPGCIEFLARTAHLPKVVVTNGEREQQLRKLKVGGLAQHLVAAITPEDCGFWKPHPGIFKAALVALDVEPSSCMMVGDDQARDLAPALALGMKGFLVEIGNPERTLLHAVRET